MEMAETLERAKRQLAALTGLKPVTVTRVFRDEQGWHVGLELLEMARIPAATDLLGYYEALLSDDGQVLEFSRKRTRLRGQAAQEE
ncbi:MAG: gas vesicle protein [Chloroflexi bacterium]|nr:gas vesicle protein [Chloroflexota bacterium]